VLVPVVGVLVMLVVLVVLVIGSPVLGWMGGGWLVAAAGDQGELDAAATDGGRRAGVGVLAGVAGEPVALGVVAGAGRGGQHGLLTLPGPGQHRGDLRNRHDVEVRRPFAGGLERVGTVAADQAEEPVDRTHPGPGQRVVEQPLGIDPDVLPVRGAGGDQPGQVPQRIPGILAREVLAVGGPPPGGCRGWVLTNRPAPEPVE